MKQKEFLSTPDEIKCKTCGHAKRHHTHPDHPVRGNDNYSYTYGMFLWCLPPYIDKSSSCGCDGFVDPRPLSKKQKDCLLQLVNRTSPPLTDYRKRQGRRKTFVSLQRRWLIEYDGYGWKLTKSGEKIAKEIK